MSLEDARLVVDGYIDYYNEVRLNSAIGYIAPKIKLEGREKQVFKERDKKLEAAREARRLRRRRNRTVGNKNDNHLLVNFA